MKKYTYIFISILPGIALVVYILSIPPNIGQPVTLSIFFALLIMFFISLMHFLLGAMKGRRRRLVWSIVTGLFLTYLIALGSLGALSVANLAIAGFVLSAILFMADRSKL